MVRSSLPKWIRFHFCFFFFYSFSVERSGPSKWNNRIVGRWQLIESIYVHIRLEWVRITHTHASATLENISKWNSKQSRLRKIPYSTKIVIPHWKSEYCNGTSWGLCFAINDVVAANDENLYARSEQHEYFTLHNWKVEEDKIRMQWRSRAATAAAEDAKNKLK